MTRFWARPRSTDVRQRSQFWRALQRQRREAAAHEQQQALEAAALADAKNAWFSIYNLFDRGPGVVYIYQKRQEIENLLAAYFLAAREEELRRARE